MGKEKRLFLLAVMTVIISTVGYGKDIDMPEKVDKDNNSSGIILNEGDTSKITTTTTIDNGKTGITIKGGEVTNKTKNKNKIEIKGSAVGVDITSGKGTFNNEGKIEVKQGTGIKISGSVKNENGEIISGGILNNTGEIKILNDNGVGIELVENEVINAGKVIVDKGTGVKLSGTNGERKFTNKGTISVKTGNGIILGHKEDTAVNDKEIKVIGGTGKGISMSAGNFTNSETGTIIVSSGNGIEQAGGTSKNLGSINVSGNGTGVNVSGGKATNENFIKVTGNGTGVKISDGEFINNNKIEIGKGTGIEVLGGNSKNIGEIKITNGGTGVKVKNSNFINEKDIIVQIGTGIALENSLFINSGEITGAGTAIQSIKGNNTVYLKNGSKVTGKIVGADGIDVLGLGAGTYKNLDVSNYEVIAVRGKDVKIEKSMIGLEYNKGTESYLIKEANKNMDKHDGKSDGKAVSGNLTIADTTLAINFKDALTNGKENGLENPIINVGKDGTLTFEKGITLVLDSSDGSKRFDIYEALGFGKDENGEDKNGELILGLNGNIEEVFNKTAVWNYYKDSNGHLIAEKESYDNVVLKSQLKDFANFLDKQEIGDTGIGAVVTSLETLKTQEAFTNAVTQLSGGVHGYIVDFAALNARTMTNTMRNRALTRDYMRKRPLNSWTQDVSYIDNNHRLGGLMNVDYTEKGVLGISEKQILPNGRLGLVYGGSKGNAKFEGGQNGSSTLDGVYFGGYYNHEFNDKWSLNSNANFVYTHNKVTRNIDITYKDKDKKEIKNPTFKSAYPTYTVGMGTSLIYTVKDDLRNKAHFYAGVDVERIMVGNINENRDQKDDSTGLAIKRDEKHGNNYYSIVPSAGFMVQNTGYVFDRKYRIGADLNWETEVGNIKDGKRIKLTGLDKEYKIETSERENVFSYSLFGALDLTESLSVNARYTSMFSDEYGSDMIGAGFEYKMDTMADNIFGDFAHRLENRRTFSDRWGMTLGLMMETDDADDAVDKDKGTPVIGENITSMEYKPKITLSINDKKSNWSYYFEAYHKTNDLFGSRKGGEKESHATRYHGEARWNDTYSKGSYGMSFGYRNEFSEKPYYLTSKGKKEVNKNGTHELRLTPSFTYDLGHGFTLGGKSAIVFMYKYEGDRAGQMDMNTESQIGVLYSGFMPRWDIAMNFYREDTWYDHSNSKYDWNKEKRDYLSVAKKDQVNQLRPSITYYFGNGANVRFDARIPLGNGKWVNSNDGTKGNESYETRYGFNYTFPVTPGFTATVGGTFLNYKDKTSSGEFKRYYAFRPNIGFSYSF